MESSKKIKSYVYQNSFNDGNVSLIIVQLLFWQTEMISYWIVHSQSSSQGNSNK